MEKSQNTIENADMLADKNIDYIEVWKTYMDLIKDNNAKRFNANLTFVATSIASFYFMYKDGMKISVFYIFCTRFFTSKK